MFCMKCGEIIEDGEKLCQACRQPDSSVKKKLEETLEKTLKNEKTRLGKTGEDAKTEFQKALEKKTKQVVRKIMVKTGLKKETPLDKAKDMWKKIKR